MRKFLKHILLAGVVALAAACGKDTVATDDKGAVNFDIRMSSIARIDADSFSPETLKVRIYNGEGLLRRYTSMEEIPSPLYLVAGNYSVKVEAGDTNNTAFKAPTGDDATERLKQMLCYYGTQEFTVEAHSVADVSVACPTLNSKISVGFTTANDYQNGKRVYENGMLSNVKITVAAVATDATSVADYKSAVAAAKAPKLTFDGSGDGYFIMPEDVTTLAWAFEATHATDGAVARVGKIENVEAGKGYKVNFYYSRTSDGYVGITVKFDDTTVDIESDFNFKPQPEITGEGLSADGVNLYVLGSGGVSLVCESINDLQTLKLGDVAFFDGGEVVADHGIVGLTVSKESATKVTMAMSDDFFKSLPGAMQTLEFDMLDTGGETIAQSLKFKKRGLVREAIVPDLWANTVGIEAFIPEAGVSSVKIRYRRSDATEWYEKEFAPSADNTYIFKTTTEWIEGTNKNGHKVYTPNLAKGIFADHAYDCELYVDGECVETFVLDTHTTQSIPMADFEDKTMDCFGDLSSSGTAYPWGSGNNSTAGTLCHWYRPGIDEGGILGATGNAAAKLTALRAGMLGIYTLAAGNLFLGNFKMSGSDGTVSFGIPYTWEARPTAMKLKYYTQLVTVNMNYHSYGGSSSVNGLKEGDPDEGSIYVAIVEWSSPHAVTSGMSDPKGVWSPDGGSVQSAVTAGKIIGYGVVYPRGTTKGNEMLDLEIPIYYYDTTDKKPSSKISLVISAATSRYGDYMLGCTSSVMYVDDFQWVYDTPKNLYDEENNQILKKEE